MEPGMMRAAYALAYQIQGTLNAQKKAALGKRQKNPREKENHSKR